MMLSGSAKARDYQATVCVEDSGVVQVDSLYGDSCAVCTRGGDLVLARCRAEIELMFATSRSTTELRVGCGCLTCLVVDFGVHPGHC